MTNRVGRVAVVSAVPSYLPTASAFAARDALGSAYEIKEAVGQGYQGGGVLIQSNIYLTASGATPNIRAHFFMGPPSAVSGGDTMAWLPAQHLGYVEHVSWVTAGNNLIESQVTTQRLGLYNTGGARSVYCMLQDMVGGWGLGASATPLQHNIGVSQD